MEKLEKYLGRPDKKKRKKASLELPLGRELKIQEKSGFLLLVVGSVEPVNGLNQNLKGY